MPIFQPWEEPNRHREKGKPGQPAKVTEGRRPSQLLLVRGIRREVDAWRAGEYPGVTKTTRYLLDHWFNSEHVTPDDNGGQIVFRYHWAQREAIETIIYLYEVRKLRSVSNMLSEMGGEELADLANSIRPEEDRWPKNCCKIATGGGKTKVMSLAIVWSYFNALREEDTGLAKHFVLIAPNLTVYERLKDDFENNVIFDKDPLIPAEWKGDFQFETILQDNPGGASRIGALYLTNIHRLFEDKGTTKTDTGIGSIFGPTVSRANALDTGAALRTRIASHTVIMVLNDEAHHLHDPELAWNKAIDSLHSQSISRGNRGICLQLDFTATPKHNDGKFFKHIICDFPLGEAVDGGIVKVPVIGESDQIPQEPDKNLPVIERYRVHLQLGYKRYEEMFERFSKVRKPVLFVMTEDSIASNEIANYLDSDQFPLLKGKVLNIHINLKGKIKKVKRGGVEYTEFVESEKEIDVEDLKALRKMTRELDSIDSPYRAVVSVLMLREGWDVRNVTTIIPLRPYSSASNILPEQTLGRGLRRMFPGQNVPEMVSVIHHPAFTKLYEEAFEQEGVEIIKLPGAENLRESVSIFVDFNNKDVAGLEISIPRVSDAYENKASLEGLTIEEIQDYFDSHLKVLPIGKDSGKEITYKERVLFTDEKLGEWKIKEGLLANAYTAVEYYVQILGKQCGLPNPHNFLHPLVEEFISRIMFEHEVDLYNGEVDHRMRDADVKSYILSTFAPLILKYLVVQKDRKTRSSFQTLSSWKPYQASSTEDRPAVKAKRTMFNLVPCDSGYEAKFADFLDTAVDVKCFAKNSGPQKLMIDYLKPDGHPANYVPDYFITLTDGSCALVELKGKSDELVPRKARAAMEWCKTASTSGTKWEYVYIPQAVFINSAPNNFVVLARACSPALQGLLKEAETTQLALPLDEAVETQAAMDHFAQVCKDAGIVSVPKELDSLLRQTVETLDFAIRSNHTTLSAAFQPLLSSFDRYGLKILANTLKPKLPEQSKRYDYFHPFISMIPENEIKSLVEYGQKLESTLVYGRPSFILGTLLFCLRYAKEGPKFITGVWEDVRVLFKTPGHYRLYDELNQVNGFRNSYVAHSDNSLTDAEIAWKELGRWMRTLVMMAEMG